MAFTRWSCGSEYEDEDASRCTAIIRLVIFGWVVRSDEGDADFIVRKATGLRRSAKRVARQQSMQVSKHLV